MMKRLLICSACIGLAVSGQALAQSDGSVDPAQARDSGIAPIIENYSAAHTAAPAARLRGALAFADAALLPTSGSLALPAEWRSRREQFSVLFGRDWKGFNGETWGRDTLLFVPLASAMPEPETWLSLMLGFGLIGGALRRGRAARSRLSQA